MANQPRPSRAMIKLGAAVRRHRTAAGLTQVQLCKEINYSDGWLSTVETAQFLPERRQITAIENALSLPEGTLMDLYDLALEDPLPIWFRDWPKIEEASEKIRNYQSMTIPGLLQTEDYARALLPEDEAAVRARMERQRILTREEPAPPMLRCIIDERALHREVGGPRVMRAQLDHLVAISSARVSVHIVQVGVHAGLSGNFVIVTLPGGGLVGYVDTAARGLIMESDNDINALVDAFESLRDDALPRRESLQIIEKAAQQWKTR